jgi:hypothetical protein
MNVRKGEPWGGPPAGPPDASVEGPDAALAAAAAGTAGLRVAFAPSSTSDLGRALGIGGSRPGAHEVPLDGLHLDAAPRLALNAVVLGIAPDRLRWWTRDRSIEVTVDGRERFRGRATTVLVANGQYLRGADVVPRGHPGDGRAEVQVYALTRGERRPMRRRLAQGAHVPHPRIRELSGRRIEVRVAGAELPLEVDRVGRGARRELTVEVVPEIVRVVV